MLKKEDLRGGFLWVLGILFLVFFTMLASQNKHYNDSLMLLQEKNTNLERELYALRTSIKEGVKPDSIPVSEKIKEYATQSELYDLKRSIHTLILAQQGQISVINDAERELALYRLDERGVKLKEFTDLFGSPATIMLPEDTEVTRFEDGTEYQIPSLGNIRIGFLGSTAALNSKFHDVRNYIQAVKFQDNQINRRDIHLEPSFLQFSDYLYSDTIFGLRNESDVRDIFSVEIDGKLMEFDIHRPQNIEQQQLEIIELLIKTIKPVTKTED